MIKFLIYSVFTLCAFNALAADGSILPEGASPWLGLIPLLLPILVSLIKKWLPHLPSEVIPVLCVVMGPIATMLSNAAGLSSVSPTVGFLLGSAAIGVREVYDQLANPRETPLPTKTLVVPTAPK